MSAIKKAILRIIALMLFAFLITGSLYLRSEKINGRANGFKRSRKPVISRKLYEIAAGPDNYRIAGATNNHIYISTLLHGILLDIDLDSRYCKRDTLKGFYFPRVHVPFQMRVDSPAISIAVGNFKNIYFGDIDRQQILDSARTAQTFLRSCKVADRQFAICTLDTGREPGHVFGLLDTRASRLKISRSIFEKKEDGLISKDGLLDYDADSRTLVYSLFYESRIIGLDSLLRPKFVLHTIDTFNRNATRGGGLISADGSKISYTSNSPRYTINANISVNQGLIFIQSALKADNDSKEDFINNTVIDVYSIREQIYLSSFYIPRVNQEKLFDFKVMGGRLIVLYPTRVVVYEIENV
jgi:hypothetical protein